MYMFLWKPCKVAYTWLSGPTIIIQRNERNVCTYSRKPICICMGDMKSDLVNRQVQ